MYLCVVFGYLKIVLLLNHVKITGSVKIVLMIQNDLLVRLVSK